MPQFSRSLLMAAAPFLMAADSPADSHLTQNSLPSVSAQETEKTESKTSEKETQPEAQSDPSVQAFENFMTSRSIQLQPVAYSSANGNTSSMMVLAFNENSGCIKFDARQNLEQLSVSAYFIVTAAQRIEAEIEAGRLAPQARNANRVYLLDTSTGQLRMAASAGNEFSVSSVCGTAPANAQTGQERAPDDFSDVPPMPPAPVRIDPRTIA